ncbi:MAG: STAS domain-containing protein [Syntrophomonadaceae bacterium]|nr:STAS domain-containing protein [Syntrophomonadaceae bacterium]
MHIKDSKKDQATIVMIEGRLDSSNSGMLEKKITALLEAGETNFLFDFTAMDYISSAGLRVLLMAAKKSKANGGRVVLSALTENVKEVFDIAGFSSIFPIFATPGEALGSF